MSFNFCRYKRCMLHVSSANANAPFSCTIEIVEVDFCFFK